MNEQKHSGWCEFPHCGCPIDKVTICARGLPDAPPEKQGDCDLCGRWSSALVDGVCVPCRRMYPAREFGREAHR